jgi:hypothetical protein
VDSVAAAQVPTVQRADSEMKPKEAHERPYVAWCQGQGLEPVSFAKFGSVVKGELGFPYVDRNKCGFYDGIALIRAAMAVAN